MHDDCGVCGMGAKLVEKIAFRYSLPRLLNMAILALTNGRNARRNCERKYPTVFAGLQIGNFFVRDRKHRGYRI